MGKGNWKCQVKVSTSDDTNTSMKIKASCIWDSNDWSYNMNGVTGWVYINGTEYKVYDNGSIDCSSGNTKTLGSKTVTINKNHGSQSISCYAKIRSTSSYSSGTETSGTTKKTVSAKPSYTVSYNTNGGSSAPGNQTKWYGENLTLSSTTPSKSGYSFNGWSGSDGNVYWPNGTYSGNSALTLTARWTPNTYTVSYNGNGATSGVPGNQTKWYGENLTLSSTTPSKSGYSFNGWSGSDGNVYWPNGTYTGNSALTLTARWNEITYTVSYNANGGSGAPGNQTKYYTSNLTLSGTKPNLTNYNFKGWSTYQNGPVIYQPDSIYSNNANVTLWAVWELAYIKPRITNFSVHRCASDGSSDENGTYIKVEAHWETDKSVGTEVSGSSVKIKWGLSSASSLTEILVTPSTTKTSDDINIVIGGGTVSIEDSYVVQVYVNDVTGYNETAKYPIPAVSYPIDIKKYGKGIAFGGVASEENVMDVNFKARFNQGQKMWETINSGNDKRWQYLGQIQINRQGDYAHFKIFGGAGQNAGLNQNMLMDIILKKGYQSEPSATNYVGVTYNIYKMNDDRYNTDNVKVKVLCRTVGYAEVYVYFDWPWSGMRYTIDGVFDNFIRGSGNDLTELPTDGVEQPCIGGVVPILYNGDLTINSGDSTPSRIYLGTRNANLGDTELRTLSKALDIGIGNDAAGAFRIWDFTHGKDVLRCTSEGVNTFNGHANWDVALKSQIYYASWHSIVLTRSDDTWLNIILYGSNTLKEGAYSIANDFKLYTIGRNANVELTIPTSAIASINRADWGFEINVRRSGISGDTQGDYNGIAIVSSGNLVLRST